MCERLLLPRLAKKLSQAVGFRIERSSERQVVPDVCHLERAFQLPAHDDKGSSDPGEREG